MTLPAVNCGLSLAWPPGSSAWTQLSAIGARRTALRFDIFVTLNLQHPTKPGNPKAGAEGQLGNVLPKKDPPVRQASRLAVLAPDGMWKATNAR